MKRGTRGHRSWPQRLLLLGNCLIIVVALVLAGFLSLTRQRLERIQVVSLGGALASSSAPDATQNILLIGTDSVARLDPSDPQKKERSSAEHLADVIIIVRLDPKAGTVRMLSIPRDSYVPIQPFGRPSKINSAMAGSDGPANLIRTIRTEFGIPIHHYIEIDFRGFQDLVELLGGVPVYLSHQVRDNMSLLSVSQTGCVRLAPDQALAYARSRHLEYLDNGKWRSDPTGDLGRISRQQDFIRRAAQQAISKGVRDPSAALSLISAASKLVTLDDTLSAGDLKSLADHFRNFNVDQMERMQLPTVGAGDSSFSYQNVDWTGAQPMLAKMTGSDGGELNPRDVSVDVRGTPPDVVNALVQRGFDALASTAAPGAENEVRFGPGAQDAAVALARYFDSSVRLVPDPTLTGRRLVLSGAATTHVLDQPRPAAEITVSEDTSTTSSVLKRTPTTTAKAGAGSTTVASSEAPVTTTTVIGIVPVDDARAQACR